MKLTVIALSLALANFTYQAMFADTPNYLVAFERSYFQWAALLAVFFFEVKA